MGHGHNRSHWGSEARRRRYAELIDPFIPRDDDEPVISGADLDRKTGLSRHQRYAGIAYLREHASAPNLEPLVSSSRGYRITHDAVAVWAFRHARVGSALTIMTRAYFGAIKPFLEVLAKKNTSAGLLMRQVERVIEDLEYLVSAKP